MAMFYTWIYHCQRFLYVSEFGCGFGDVDFMVPLGSEYLFLTGYRCQSLPGIKSGEDRSREIDAFVR